MCVHNIICIYFDKTSDPEFVDLIKYIEKTPKKCLTQVKKLDRTNQNLERAFNGLISDG